MASALVFAEDLGNELTLGQCGMVPFDLVAGDVDPKWRVSSIRNFIAG
jgi:hypothetical protein